jgi:hypothetical protein
MAGASAASELSRATATRFAVATPADDAAIRRLLRDNAMRGSVNLTFEREPGYFRGADLAGGEDQTIVAFSDSRLVCMGRCAQRECWLDGKIRRVGYLAELRLDALARGRFGVLRDGYCFFHALQADAPADLYFTSIAADNHRARSLLERGVRGLPAYAFLAELDTLLVAVPSRASAARFRVEKASPAQVPALVGLLNDHARRHQLAAAWTVKSLTALHQHGLPLERFFVALEGNEIIAAGALWDQRAFRQTVVRGYAPLLSAARPFLNLAGQILGFPRLPEPDSVLAHAFLSPLAFTPGAEAMLPNFIGALFPMAARMGIEFLTLALPASDPRLAKLRRRFSTRTWRSRLYRVDWPDHTRLEMRMQGAAFLPEVALL